MLKFIVIYKHLDVKAYWVNTKPIIQDTIVYITALQWRILVFESDDVEGWCCGEGAEGWQNGFLWGKSFKIRVWNSLLVHSEYIWRGLRWRQDFSSAELFEILAIHTHWWKIWLFEKDFGSTGQNWWAKVEILCQNRCRIGRLTSKSWFCDLRT
mgnify:CR=1 FL=1